MNDIYQTNTYRNGNDLGNYQSVFRKKTERINWKRLAAVDVDRVTQCNDVAALRDNIKHIAFCDIDSEMEVRGGDRTLVKMFKMLQLMVDYLLSSQEHLAGLASESEERCVGMAEGMENAKRKVQESETYISEIKRECHRRKKLILAQQQIMDSGPETYHRCPYCTKAFLNGSFLQAHLEKRHSERYIRSMYLIDQKRETSPHREPKHDFHSSSERRIEELVRQFSDQQRMSGDKNEEMEHMRRMMEEMMKQQRDEMGAVINDLERKLEEAYHRQHKKRSHLGDLLDDNDDYALQKAGEKAREKALREKQKQKQATRNIEQPIVAKRQPKTIPTPSSHDAQRRTSPRSPVRGPSPDKVNKSLSGRNSADSASMRSESPDFGRMWKMNEQYRLQAREEVVNMLAEHLEHHGIKRTASGIPDTVLHDKLSVTDMEQRQLAIKFVDFADIRKRLVAEVEKEAASRLQRGHSPARHQQHLGHQRPNTAARSRSPQTGTASRSRSPPVGTKAVVSVKKDLIVSSDSDWDDKSAADVREAVRMRKEAQEKSKREYVEDLEDIMRSPKKQPGQTNNARASSDYSNTMNSSMWAPSESRAVTSVAAPGLTHKTVPANKSSDLGNHTDSFDE